MTTGDIAGAKFDVQYGVAMKALLFRATLFACVLFVGLAPASGQIQNGMHVAPEGVRQAHAIGLALFSYANDNNGDYPTGSSSTEVFQKLIDGGYVSDPALFYVPMPGKVRPTTGKLKPENVSFDVTAGVDLKSSDAVPILFMTGFLVDYTVGSAAVPLTEDAKKRDGMVIFYHSNSTQFLIKDPNGTVRSAIPKAFDGKGHHYQQLTPDGPPGLV